jgi:hypothetical protein
VDNGIALLSRIIKLNIYLLSSYTCAAPSLYGMEFKHEELEYLEFNYGLNNFDSFFEALLSAF